MKKRNLLFTMVAASFLLAACSDDLGGRHVPAPGEAITFGVSGITTFDDGYSNMPESRTAYGVATHDDKGWHYPLNWVEGDEVGIYCEQAEGDKNGYYQIKIDEQDASKGLLIAMQDAGLKWGTGLHTFHAFYPASAMRDDAQWNGTTLNAEIPKEQVPVSIDQTDNGYVAKPNMQYAFMSAEAKDVNPGDAISLHFTPLTTAVDITITAGEVPVKLSNVQVAAVSKDGKTAQGVCGKFQYDITNGNVTLLSDAINDYRINVPLHQSADKPYVELQKGQTLTFTVFLLPGTDENGDRILHNLQVRVPAWEGSTNVKTYEGVEIHVSTKSQIILPALVQKTDPPYDANTWMASVDSRTYVSQLSIPAASNAFSKDIHEDTYREGGEIVQTQVQTVEEMFKAGVRAFEIHVERADPWNIQGGEPNLKNLGDAPLIAGGDLNFSLNFRSAILRLQKLVQDYPTEFVVVMPVYMNNDEGNPEAYCNQLKNFLQNPGGEIDVDKIQPYTNGVTVGAMRGKILFLSRMPGTKEECDEWVGTPQKTTAIYGWNNDKDRWERRGYDVTSGFNNYEEVSWLCWDGKNEPKRTSPIPDWEYEGVAPGGEITTFHVQDWYRVCPEKKSYTHKNASGISTTWYESKQEKLDDIKTFLDETIAALKNSATASDVYINSLSGYYITSGSGYYSGQPHPTDYTFGKRGDIPNYAVDVNNEIYRYILDVNNQLTQRGPMGIVLINYVNAAQAFNKDVYGDYILHALIDNNFRFLMTGNPDWEPSE